ncbi:hypothetical protein [Streptomyces sp. NPDC058644]|uniref:hypothetical protein n=1 Tax=unclassified Streptomyces TaxID=2593676 RepID=UPI003665C389
MSDALRPRMAVLYLDKSSILPLPYVHEGGQFRTVGFVRTRHSYLPDGLQLPGNDSPEGRDAFLRELLVALLIPPRDVERIIRTAEHSPQPGSYGPPPGSMDMPYATGQSAPWAPLAQRDPTVRDGAHVVGPGMLVGLLAGLFAGFQFAGWNGAALGAFLGAAVLPDLLRACWLLLHARAGDLTVEVHDSAALLLVALGPAAGGVAGCLLADSGFGQARGLLLGMAGAGFAACVVAAGFSMVPFRQRTVIWLGPLVVSGCCWAAYTLWSSPVALFLAVLVGSQLAGSLTWRLAGFSR